MHAVLYADVLVLVGEVLGRLGDAHRRVAARDERDLVAAAQVPVAPPDHVDVHVGHAVVGDVQGEPGKLAGRRVVLSIDRPAHVRLRRRL
ncbi:MAG: hypothetical protein ACM30G_16770 [Micromonosporaceae bacterium]